MTLDFMSFELLKALTEFIQQVTVQRVMRQS